jgi:hypothetical protein
MLEELDKRAAASIDIELPDISGSLQAVRTYRLSHESPSDSRVRVPKKAVR